MSDVEPAEKDAPDLEMPPTDFPVSLFARLSRMLLGSAGWRLEGRAPDEPRFILLGVPHTSNWDLALAVLGTAGLGVRARWIGKDTLFRFPKNLVTRSLGGIPVVRGSRSGSVDLLAELIMSFDRLALCIAPEGTRKYVDHWKSGFYRIASAANIPVALGFVDYPNKRAGIGPVMALTGAVDADMNRIAGFYADKQGRFPENKGAIRLKTD